MKGKKIVIIGGYGGMGQIFAKLFNKEGCDVVITGPTEQKGISIAKELGVVYEKDNIKAVTKADVAIITVPIAATPDVIKEVAPHIKDDALLMDLTSIKEEPCRLMAEHAGPKVEVVGVHPIFGPRIESIDGQVFVMTPVRGIKWPGLLKELLLKHHARIVESTPVEHDEVMAVVQGLTHFAYIALGKTFDEMDFDVKRSRQFASPIYDLMLDMIGRIIGQDPHLYAEIQMQNQHVPRIHDAYIKTAQTLSKVVRDKDEKLFVKMMAEAAKNFDDVERAMGRSDKAISSLVSELEKLKQSIGVEICVKHIYSGKKHLGTVKSVTGDEVILAEGGKEQKFKLSNIVILDDTEKLGFKKSKYGTIARDYSAILLLTSNDEFIASLIKEHDENIVSIKIMDVYLGKGLPEGMKSVCYRVEYINEDISKAESRMQEFFSKIGGKLR